MTYKFRFESCAECGAEIDTAQHSYAVREEEGRHRPMWNPSIVEDAPVDRYYCSYCAEEKGIPLYGERRPTLDEMRKRGNGVDY